ncbi:MULTISPECIES: ECF transporter S component [Terrabacteria group]|uniref:ECF transporter S component n=1 Tax=Bacillati TaxID=1783272 RepID=UPI001939E41E|nr:MULTISPECIES: ECF transporter S component [Terrabacteria group]MBW9212702.1 ECF transporter S component [Trueperella sp. zg.1013]QRG86529.1 ECF transporter S component [Bulleidia sp. zg-1006]
MQTKSETLRFIVLTFFVAIELLLALTPLGYLNVGVISITLMHLPVILAGVFMGKKEGATIGFVFGLASFLRATFAPNLTSFCFTPFYSIGQIQGNFYSLLICFGPRIFLGWLAGFLNDLGKERFPELPWMMVLSIICTFMHSISVMSLIWLFFGTAFASVVGVSVGAVIVSVLVSNGLLEMVVAGIIIPFVYHALKPIREKMNI